MVSYYLNLLKNLLFTCCLPGFLSVSFATASTSSNASLYDQKPWSLLYFYGITVDDPLLSILAGRHHRWPEHIQSLELARTLNEQNVLRKFLNPVVGVVQVAGNLAIRQGKSQATIYEFEPYLIFRWTNFPWNQYVDTSFALGEGISYVTAVPAIEKKDNSNTKRLLNYLMFEASFAHPTYPQLQLVARLHHRSGAFGLYHAGNSGSNDAGIGVRYLFD